VAFPTDQLDTTDLDVYLAEIWSTRKVNEFFRAKLVAAKFFYDASEDVVPGGDTIHIANLSAKTASTKTTDSAVTLQSDTETKIDLSIDTWKESSCSIEDKQAVQVLRSYNLQQRYISACAFACAKALDTALLGLYSGLSQSVNDSASAIADDDILLAIQYLDVEDVPVEDRGFFFYPSMKTDLASIQKYYDASMWGGQTVVQTGTIPSLYGIPVFFSTQVTVTHTDYVHNLLAHKDAFAFATQTPGGGADGVRSQVNYVPEYLCTLWTSDVIYGVIENRDACGIEIRAIK